MKPMAGIFRGKWLKLGVVAILVIAAGIAVSLYYSKKSAGTKGWQARAIESTGVAEFDPENDTANDVTPEDRKLAEVMSPVFKAMGDMKDVAKNKQAIAALNNVIARYSEWPDAYIMRATLSISVGSTDHRQILADIDNAIRIRASKKGKSAFESAAEMYALRAKIDILSNNYGQTIGDLETAVKTSLDNVGVVFNTGATEPDDDSNMTALQKKDLESLIKKHPDDYRCPMFLGLFLYEFTKFDEQHYEPVLQALERARELNPEGALVEYFMGVVHQRMAFWTKAAASDISDTVPGGEGGGFKDKARLAALEHYDKAVKLDPAFAGAYAEAAACLLSLRRYADAIPYYSKVIDIQPENAGAYHDRAIAKVNMNDLMGGIDDYSKAIEFMKSSKTSPHLDNAFENRAGAYIKREDYDKAVQDYNRAIGLKFAGQVLLMNIPQIRTMYPELKNLSDRDMLEGFRQKYYSNMAPKDFFDQYQHGIATTEKKEPYKEFVLGDLYTSRGDAYVLKKDFRSAAKDYNRAVCDGSVSILERWRLISKMPSQNTEYYLDALTISPGSDSSSLWIKVLNTQTESYSVQPYQIDCAGKRMKTGSVTHYDPSGNVTFMNPAQDWFNIVPESMGEVLYNGVCK